MADEGLNRRTENKIIKKRKERTMKLDLKGIRIVKCEYRNEMGPNTKLNLQVNVNNQIKLPKE